jgi:hypothetical protein
VLEFLIAGLPDAHPHPIVRQDLQLLDVLIGFTAHQRVDAAGVIADHASERTVMMRRRVWREGQMVLLGRVTEVVEHQARLHTGAAALGVEFEDVVQVFGHIDYDGHITTLSGQTGPTAAGQDGCPIAAGDGDGLADVVNRSGDGDSDKYLPVIRPIGGVERPAPVIKPHLAANSLAQLSR